MVERELLIGLSGVKGSGKTTTSEMLAELLPDLATVAWADALKDDVLAIANQALHWEHWKKGGWASDFAPLTRDDMERLKGEIFGPMLQGYGAMMRRLHGADYWIRRWEERAPGRVIVPDTRYHNEADYLKGHNGVLVYVEGPSRWEGDARSPSHESERSIAELKDRADYVIDNTGPISELRAQVEVLADALAETYRHVARAA